MKSFCAQGAALATAIAMLCAARGLYAEEPGYSVPSLLPLPNSSISVGTSAAVGPQPAITSAKTTTRNIGPRRIIALLPKQVGIGPCKDQARNTSWQIGILGTTATTGLLVALTKPTT